MRRLFACILDASVRIKKRENQLGRATHDICTRVAKYTEVYVGIWEHLF
jgi:hypothetical protein